jgi:hypothetical protein
MQFIEIYLESFPVLRIIDGTVEFFHERPVSLLIAEFFFVYLNQAFQFKDKRILPGNLHGAPGKFILFSLDFPGELFLLQTGKPLLVLFMHLPFDVNLAPPLLLAAIPSEYKNAEDG